MFCGSSGHQDIHSERYRVSELEGCQDGCISACQDESSADVLVNWLNRGMWLGNDAIQPPYALAVLAVFVSAPPAKSGLRTKWLGTLIEQKGQVTGLAAKTTVRVCQLSAELDALAVSQLCLESDSILCAKAAAVAYGHHCAVFSCTTARGGRFEKRRVLAKTLRLRGRWSRGQLVSRVTVSNLKPSCFGQRCYQSPCPLTGSKASWVSCRLPLIMIQLVIFGLSAGTLQRS